LGSEAAATHPPVWSADEIVKRFHGLKRRNRERIPRLTGDGLTRADSPAGLNFSFSVFLSTHREAQHKKTAILIGMALLLQIYLRDFTLRI
jgi:hypothetical protein